MRRLVRSRVFNSARTATRNRDLPLAMEDPHLTHQPVYCIGGFRPVYGGNTAGFSSVRRLCRRVFLAWFFLVAPVVAQAKSTARHLLKCQLSL